MRGAEYLKILSRPLGSVERSQNITDHRHAVGAGFDYLGCGFHCDPADGDDWFIG
jgi:hypothetical protein